MRMSLSICWCNIWVGAYWDRSDRSLYVCLVPCLALRFRCRRRASDYDWNDPRRCAFEGHRENEHETFRYHCGGGDRNAFICSRCGVVQRSEVAVPRTEQEVAEAESQIREEDIILPDRLTRPPTGPTGRFSDATADSEMSP
jgi:hypothetical protein